MASLTADFLVIGAGNSGVAFCDSLLQATAGGTTTCVLADRNDRPGGHWLFAYPFVSLHQPSWGYGVESAELSTFTVDKHGVNAGLESLASGQEVEAYMKRVVSNLVDTGRLIYLPLHEWDAKKRVLVSKVTGKEVQVNYKKLVLGNHHTTLTSALRPPPWRVAPGVTCVPSRNLPAALSALPSPPQRFCVIGGGKTGMDCVVWILQQGVTPDQIVWVIPRDFYAMNRESSQSLQNKKMGAKMAMGQRIAVDKANSIDEAIKGLVECGHFLKLASTTKEPTAFHGAIITRAELLLLNQIQDIEKRGHVTSIDATGFDIANGTLRRELPASTTLYVDCAAETVSPKPRFKIWQDNTIILPFMAAGGVGYSAGVVARLETMKGMTDAAKNAILRPQPFPDTPLQYFLLLHTSSYNLEQIFKIPELARWSLRSRLGPLGPSGPRFPKDVEIPEQVLVKIAKSMEERRKVFERLLLQEAERGTEEVGRYLREVGVLTGMAVGGTSKAKL